MTASIPFLDEITQTIHVRIAKYILLYVDQQNMSWSMQLFMLEVLQYHPKGSPSYDAMYQTSYTEEVILK